MKLSIIIPVFNEERTITSVIHAVGALVIPRTSIEILVIDDGSTDRTKEELQKVEKKYKNLSIVSHKKNLGKGAAIRTAIQQVTGDYIVIQDADLEYNPEDIKKLVVALKENHDVIYGTRLHRVPHFSKEEKTGRFFLHYIGNRSLSFVTSILYGQWITDMETCYKLIPTKAISPMRLHARGFEFEPEITAKLMKFGYKIKEVPITTIPRGYAEGKKLQTFRDGYRALWALIKYRFTN